MFSIVFFLVMVGLMYVLLIVPRQREMRRQAQMLEVMGEGDQVMASSGIYGTVRWVDGEFVGLEISDGVVVKIAKRAVMSRVAEVGPEAGSETGPGSTAADGCDDDDGGSGDDETGAEG